MQSQTTMSALWKSLLPLLIVLLFSGCGPQEELAEPEFGFGDRADHLCDDTADLCWPSEDLQSMSRLLGSEIDLLLEPHLAEERLAVVFEHLDALSHKLSPEELEATEHLRSAGQAPEQVLEALNIDVLRRLKGHYYAASMVPVGRDLLFGGSERADELATPMSGDYSEGINTSLARLRESGVWGNMYASMLVLTGALSEDYHPRYITGAPFGVSREKAVQSIIGRYRRASGAMGLLAGGVSLVPIAGLAVAIPMDSFATFAVHSRMTFEIAAVYGWDINQGTQLFTMTMFMFSDGEFEQMVESLSVSASLPTLVRGLASYMGIAVSVPFAAKVAIPSLTFLLRHLVRVGERILAKSGGATAGKAVLGQVLGWATMGLTVVGTAVADYYVTDLIGEHVRVLSKRWLVDIPSGGDDYIRDEQDRRCFFSALSAVAQADGRVSPREKVLYQTFLGKAYYAGRRDWYRLSTQQRVQYAGFLASGIAGAKCSAPAFRDERAPERLAFIGQLLAMSAIDLEESPAEVQITQEVHELLRERASWTDSRVGDNQIHYIRQVIRATLHPTDVGVPEEFMEAVEALTPEHLIDYLNARDAAVQSDFNCGYAGHCSS